MTLRVAKWKTTDNVYAMLKAVQRRTTVRRLRLFALACCESVLSPPEVRSFPAAVRAVRAAEFESANRDAVQAAARLATEDCAKWSGQHPQHQWALAALRLADNAFAPDTHLNALVMTLGWHVAAFLRSATSASELLFDEAKISHPFSDVMREVFPSTKRPRFLRRWHTETVRLLADGIHADQAFDRLPILADALEEAGCDNAELLAHCRGPGPHVLGCWALDLVRGCY